MEGKQDDDVSEHEDNQGHDGAPVLDAAGVQVELHGGAGVRC